MGELFRRCRPEVVLPWTGERLVSDVNGSIESEHLHRYFLARELCRGKKILDIASGEGYGTALLSQTALDVIGVEIDQQSVLHASRAYQSANLRYIQGEASHLPLKDESVDVVVSFETLEHFWDHKTFLMEVKRVLIPGGLLIISTPDSDVYSGVDSVPNPFHIRELTKLELCDTLRSVFQNLLILQQRIFAGSAMLPDTMPCSGKTFVFEQRDTDTFESSKHLPRAPYLIALASNATVPLINATLYLQSKTLETENSDMLAELDRLRQVEAAAREQAPVLQQALNEAAAAREESARLVSTRSSLQTDLDRSQQVEAAAREQVSALTQDLHTAVLEREETTRLNSVLKKELDGARKGNEAADEQLNTAHLLAKQQTLVIQRLQNESTRQAQNCQSLQKEVLLMKTDCQELAAKLSMSQAEALKYSQTLEQVAGLIVPVWIRKLFPSSIRRPVQILKQKMRAQAHRTS